MKYINNDIEIYYEVYGTGQKNIIILPGWGNTRNTFKCLINNLMLDYTIYIFDYPGFGKSKFPNHDLTIFDYANLIKKFIKANKINNPILIGHSFGGRIIVTLCGYYCFKINKIVLIDASSIKPKQKFSNKIKYLTYKCLKKLTFILPCKLQKKIREKLINIFGSSDYRSLPIEQRNTFRNIVNCDLKPYIKNIKAETLIIWGEKDVDTPLNDAYIFHEEILDSGLVIIPNAGHFPYLEYPNLICSIIRAFIDEKNP